VSFCRDGRSVSPLRKNNSGTDEAVSEKSTFKAQLQTEFGTFIFIEWIELFKTDSRRNYELLTENIF